MNILNKYSSFHKFKYKVTLLTKADKKKNIILFKLAEWSKYREIIRIFHSISNTHHQSLNNKAKKCCRLCWKFVFNQCFQNRTGMAGFTGLIENQTLVWSDRSYITKFLVKPLETHKLVDIGKSWEVKIDKNRLLM